MAGPTGSFWRRLLTVACVILLCSGAGHALARPGDDLEGIAVIIRSATAGDLGAEDLPTDFPRVMGYTPALMDGRLVKPHADCSFPVPVHPESFEAACHAHDLGYDLLRYGQRTGRNPGMSLRFQIDRRFHQDMLDACGASGCRVLAHAFSLGVALNSIRQGYTSPTLEPALPWLTLALGTVAAAWYRRRPA